MMKNQQKQIQGNLQIQKNIDKMTLSLPIQCGSCRAGNQIKFVCVSQNCKENSFICSEETCECLSFHKKCIKSILKDLIEKIQDKIINCKDLVELNNKLLDKFVESISDQAEKLKEEFRLLTSYYPINPNATAILQKIKNKKFSQCIGDQFFQVYQIFYCKNTLKNTPEINLQMKNMNKNFQQMIKKNEQQFKKYQNLIQKNLKDNLYLQKTNSYETIQKNMINKVQIAMQLLDKFNSKIAILNMQKYAISLFFDKKIKNIELLYRASQWNFKVQGFASHCTQIPHTLILAQTQFGKKIGGYTPLKWRKDRTRTIDDNDESQKSFIFSLTQNEKLKPQNKNNGIRNQLNKGPIFRGRYNNLQIANDSEKNKNQADICCGYVGQSKFKQNNEATNKLFNGSAKYKDFKIKEWQVWKLTFEQQQ